MTTVLLTSWLALVALSYFGGVIALKKTNLL